MRAPVPSADLEPGPPAAAADPAAAQPAAEPQPKALKQVCGSCHALPDPEILARSVWPKKIKEMYEIAGSPKTVAGMAPWDVAQWYERHAPKSHAYYLGPTSPTPGALHLSPHERRLTPPGALPAIANVNLVQLLDDEGLELLVAEQKANKILYFAPRHPERGVRTLGTVTNPCHTEVADVDGDGHRDVVVASLGTFWPGNERVGSVHVLRGDGKGGFEGHVVADGLGRVADARPADFDGDGDIDIVVAVFGWRENGQVLLLENTGKKRDGFPVFRKETLVERVGAIHVPPVDVDGDGDLDFYALFAQHYEHVSLFVNQGGLRFDEKILWTADHPAWGFSGLELADLDADGDQDLLLTNGDSFDIAALGTPGEQGPELLLLPYQGIRWLENRGGGAYAMHDIAPMYGAHRAEAADMDGDGDLDIVASAFMPVAPEKTIRAPLRVESLVWLEQTVPGTWVRHTLRTMDVEMPTLDLGDYDGDGDVDIVTGHFFLGRFRKAQREISVTFWENR